MVSEWGFQKYIIEFTAGQVFVLSASKTVVGEYQSANLYALSRFDLCWALDVIERCVQCAFEMSAFGCVATCRSSSQNWAGVPEIPILCESNI